MTESASVFYLCVIRIKLAGFLFCLITEKKEKKYVIAVYISANRGRFHSRVFAYIVVTWYRQGPYKICYSVPSQLLTTVWNKWN
jgi:hypothetical protein